MLFVVRSHGMFIVSLFTREWIEITAITLLAVFGGGLPLYEGVD